MQRIEAAARDPTIAPASVRTETSDGLTAIFAGPARIMVVTEVDARLEQASVATLAQGNEARIRSAIVDYRAARTPERMTRCLRVAGREIELTGPSLSERNTSGIERLGDALGASPPSQATMPLSCAADVYQSPRDRSRTDLGEP